MQCIFNGKRASGKFLHRKQANLGSLYKWPVKGKADQSFAPAAVSQLNVSTPGVGFVAPLLLSPLTLKKHTNHHGTHIGNGKFPCRVADCLSLLKATSASDLKKRVTVNDKGQCFAIKDFQVKCGIVDIALVGPHFSSRIRI